MEKELSPRNASLHKFWERAKNVHAKVNTPVSAGEWNEQVFYLSESGIGTEEALKFLYSKQPSFDAFIDWIKVSAPIIPGLPPHTEPVLTQEDRDFWRRNGYIVIKNAVPVEQCAAAREAIWEFLGADPSTPGSWYEPHHGKNGMMLSFFRHPVLDTNRRSPKIRKVYEELYGEKEIYLLVDKVSFNAPETEHEKFIGSPLHWDVSLSLPIPFELQGLLYLNDVAANDGAFHCVPGFHDRVETWLAELPEGTDARAAALRELKPIAVAGNAGDLVVWHQALPHCATPNKGTMPRMVQYIAYKPVRVGEHAVWK